MRKGGVLGALAFVLADQFAAYHGRVFRRAELVKFRRDPCQPAGPRCGLLIEQPSCFSSRTLGMLQVKIRPIHKASLVAERAILIDRAPPRSLYGLGKPGGPR